MMRGYVCALLIAWAAGRPMPAPAQEELTALASSAPDSAIQVSTAQTQSDSQTVRNQTKNTSKSSAKLAKKDRAAKRAPAAPDGTPTKIVVREGGVDEPTAQIVTGMSPEAAARERSEAELLLSTTAETLNEIAPREFTVQQQETISQIHNYMDVARSALKEGDIPRAHTLAEKAALLADDLARH
jgi:hypothetical protein